MIKEIFNYIFNYIFKIIFKIIYWLIKYIDFKNKINDDKIISKKRIDDYDDL